MERDVGYALGSLLSLGDPDHLGRDVDRVDLPCVTRHLQGERTGAAPEFDDGRARLQVLARDRLLPLEGRDIVVFHVNGEFFALLNRCPHEGAPLEKAACVARLTSPEPGVYERSRVGELLRCPWHGWEFDMRNGQSWFDPKRVKVRSYPVAVESGEELQKGPYVAETFPVHVEDSYVIIET